VEEEEEERKINTNNTAGRTHFPRTNIFDVDDIYD
jgi:hypothetical protein